MVSTASRRWWVGLLSVTLAALIAYAAGYRIEFLTNPEGGFFYLSQWSWLITLGWISVVSQGVSVLGQLDPSGRLLTKILAISGSALLLISLWQGQFFAVMLLCALHLIVLGVRTYSVPAERWSSAVGYGLALVAIEGLVKTTASVALLAPVIALGVPFTSTLSIAYSHRLDLALDDLAIGRFRALVLMYLVSAYIGIMAFLATRLEPEVFMWIVGVTSIILGILVWVLVRLPKIVAVTERKFVLFGTPIDVLTLDEAVQRVERCIGSRTSALICTPDTTAIVRAQRDPRLRALYKRADLVTPDGTGIVWAARLLGAPLRERVSGIDLLERLFVRGQELKVFLLGAAPGVAEEAARKLAQKYPNLRIVGTHHGYFAPAASARVLSMIKQAQPDIVLVGLGVPRQELWMGENQSQLGGLVLMGVGGCFDVWAGRRMRAPQGWQKLGLEWLYRVLQEPRRLARVHVIPLFLGQISFVKLAHWLCD